jgi:hypothetical protein
MDIQILDFQVSDSISVLQFESAGKDSSEYITFSKALERNEIEVKEVSESGSVNNLFVINRSEYFVFFMDGDVLSGAKQNRVLNASVLLYPGSKTNVPVSCIESGRWRYSSPVFTGSDYCAPAFMRSSKASNVKDNLETSGSFKSDQREVWRRVGVVLSRQNVKSGTSDLSEVYTRKRQAFKSQTDNFICNDSSNGFAVFLENRILSVDVFNRSDACKEYFHKILRGVAMEITPGNTSAGNLDREKASSTLASLLNSINDMKQDLHQSVGAGTEKRFGDNAYTGFELSFEDKLVHLAALKINNRL